MNIGITNNGGTIEGGQIVGVGTASINDDETLEDMDRVHQKLNEIQNILSKNQEQSVKQINIGIRNEGGVIKGRQIVGVGTALNNGSVSTDIKTAISELDEIQEILLKNQESINYVIKLLLETVTSIRSDLNKSPPNKSVATEKLDKLASIVSSMAILANKANELKNVITGLF